MIDFTRFICTKCTASHRYRPANGCRECGFCSFKTPLADAERDAEWVKKLLAGFCDRIEIAGSIRRRKQFVKDIELVAEPKMIEQKAQPTLFDGREVEIVSAIDRHIQRIVTQPGSALIFDEETPRNGSKYKRLIWQRGLAVDLFIVIPPATWGATLAIRTGPADFSKLLVTHRSKRGALPEHLYQKQGALHDREGPLDTPEESDYFAALGVPAWKPAERTAGKLTTHLKGGNRDARLVKKS